MKNFLFLSLILHQCTIASAQIEASFENDTIPLERSKTTDLTYYISVAIKRQPLEDDAMLEFSIDPSTNTQGVLDGSSFPLKRKVSAGTTSVSFPLVLLRGTNGSVSWARIQMICTNKQMISRTLTLKITDKAPDLASKNEAASFFEKITYLNAYNFDFNARLVSNYVGKFNIYHHNPGSKFGVNVGIMKINYGSDDSTSSVRFRTENVHINPLNQEEPGLKYLRQYNRHSSLVQNRAWSFYIQPLLCLNQDKEKLRLFLHGHLELLVNKFTVTTKISNLYQDTAIFAGGSQKIFVRPFLSSETVNSNTLLNGYFGAGFTFDIVLKSRSNLFLQGTMGSTTNYPQQASAPNNASSAFYYSVDGSSKLMGFYLIRGYYSHTVSDAAKLVVGTDIRGLLPAYNPLYAAYVGINLKVEEAFKFILGGKN